MESETKQLTACFCFHLKSLMHFQSMCGLEERLPAIMVGFTKSNSRIRLLLISMSSCRMVQESILANMQAMLSSIYTITQDRLQAKSGDKYLITIVRNAE